MLESMRNQAQSWIAKTILGGIILSFALWGVGDYFMGSHVQTVAEIDGNPINDVSFREAYERNLNNYRATFGKQFSKALAKQLNVKTNTLQTMINRQLMLDEAQRLGLTAPESALLNQVQNDPSFQSANGFDSDRYRIITRNMGFRSTRDYEDEQRLNLMINVMQKAIFDSTTISDKELLDRFHRDFEQRIFSAIIVNPQSLEDSIKITDAEARAYFEEHQDQYRSPLRVRLNAVEIDPAALIADIAIDDADIQNAFNERISEFTTPEKRQASHILVMLIENASEQTRSEARTKIEAAKSRIDQGESFATVAKDVSEDVSTASKGGDLGLFARDTMLDAFNDVVFNMQKSDVSDIIESQYGFHLVKLTDITNSKTQAFNKVKNQIADDLRKSKANDEAYKLSQDLDDALGMEDSLQAAATNVDLNIRKIDPVSASEALGESFLSGDQTLRALAFSRMPGDNVEITELDDGRFVAIEIIERIEPAALAFADVAAQAYKDARKQAAENKAAEIAADILNQSKHKSLDALAQIFAQPKYISKAVRSNGTGDDASWLTLNVLNAGFRTGKGQSINTVINVKQGLAIVQVQNIIKASDDDFVAQQDTLRQDVEQSKGAVRFARWMASVRDRHDIVIHQNILDRL